MTLLELVQNFTVSKFNDDTVIFYDDTVKITFYRKTLTCMVYDSHEDQNLEASTMKQLYEILEKIKYFGVS